MQTLDRRETTPLSEVAHARRLLVDVPAPILYEEVVRRGEGVIADGGPLAVNTGQHTGRSPRDKYIVREADSEEHVWWGTVNQPFDTDRFEALYRRVLAYLQGRDVYVQHCAVAAHPQFEVPVRVITDTAWHALFARNLFRRASYQSKREPFTVISVPGFRADPAVDGTRSETFIITSLGRRLTLIGGTGYAGEIKKAMFTVLNYLMPIEGVFPMHCAANVGPANHVALFFGLSGTGKTSLSADRSRPLIGDDEHGWADDGVFNFEGGCYAKVIRLSAHDEPQIYRASTRFGTVLENVVLDEATRAPKFDDETYTENTRSAYPIEFLENIVPEGRSGHPKSILLLTTDAFGVMPPIARLTAQQASYHFLSGYTARVAGTERGVGREPEATFSACFAAPFLVWHPSVYARALAERVERHDVSCWLVNTGWFGGPYGIGSRIKIEYTRAMVSAALRGELDQVPTRIDPVFGFAVPEVCPGVPDHLLQPGAGWADAAAYDQQAIVLARRFQENFRAFEGQVDAAVAAAGPRVPSA